MQKTFIMRKLQIIILGLLFTVFNSNAQVMPQFSQYMFTDYLLNPAIGGTNDYWQIKMNYHYQWAGIKDAPKTYMLGAYGPHKRLPMGYGGYIFNDSHGSFSSTGIYGSYSYNIKISGDIRLSMGLFAGVIYEKVDIGEVLDPTDPIVEQAGNNSTKVYPDGSLGVYLYTSQYFFGISANHMFFNNMSLLDNYDFESSQQSKIKQYFNIQGGYKYNINRNFDLEPTVLMKTAFNYDFITDISVRAIYQKMVWAGLGFRYNFKNPEAAYIYIGYNYNDMINIGYSYDYTVSQLRYGSHGSHEVMVGVKFNDIRRSRSKRKIR